MTRRRDQLTIMSDLLEIMQKPERMTYVLTKSNMSYSRLIKYTSGMRNLKFVKEQKHPFRSFVTTTRGNKFLEMIRLDDDRMQTTVYWRVLASNINQKYAYCLLVWWVSVSKKAHNIDGGIWKNILFRKLCNPSNFLEYNF